MAKAAAEVMVALASFVGAVGSTEVNIREGWLFASDDPIVRKYPTLFGPVVVRVSVPGARVEQATAAPGEKRGA
jgi:hypothetical protein